LRTLHLRNVGARALRRAEEREQFGVKAPLSRSAGHLHGKHGRPERSRDGTDKLTGLLQPLTISDAGKANSKEDGDALEDHDRGHGRI
jgi:hypothetical protein